MTSFTPSIKEVVFMLQTMKASRELTWGKGVIMLAVQRNLLGRDRRDVPEGGMEL